MMIITMIIWLTGKLRLEQAFNVEVVTHRLVRFPKFASKIDSVYSVYNTQYSESAYREARKLVSTVHSALSTLHCALCTSSSMMMHVLVPETAVFCVYLLLVFFINLLHVFFINFLHRKNLLHLTPLPRFTGTGSSMGVFHLSSDRPSAGRETCTPARSRKSKGSQKLLNQTRRR